MPTTRVFEVIFAIQLGIDHTSNSITFHDGKYEHLNIPFKDKSCSLSNTTPTVALFDDKGTIQSYGFEAEHQYLKLYKTSNHLLFREFISDLFCSGEMVS